MPSIKVNSIAKKLGVGFKTIVEYLNEKDDSKRYNVNSKLTTDQLRDVVNEYGNELPKEERKKLLDSYTEDSAPASDAKETTASEKEVKEKENPRQEKTQPKVTEKGPKVLGKVELDKNNEVVRTAPKKEAPKAEALKKEDVYKRQQIDCSRYRRGSHLPSQSAPPPIHCSSQVPQCA